MKQRVNTFLASATLAGLLAACGAAAPAAAPTTAPADAPTAAPADAPTTAPAAGGAGNTIKIVSSLPRTGSSKAQTDSVVNAIKQRIEEDNNQICGGQFNVVYEDMDDATAAAGKWDAAQEASNANKAAADADVMIYIGTFNSGAAKISIPILNQAGLVMISPANTYPGLTKPNTGEADEPDKYYPTGVRNYVRVVPADDLQGAAAANWANEIGAKKVFVLDDTELYGKGVADQFVMQAEKNGAEIVGRESIEGKAADYRALAAKIVAAAPDMVYYGGITQNNAGQLVKDIKGEGFTGNFMGPDGIYEEAFITAAGDAAEGVYVTFGGIPAEKLTGKAAEWYASYKAKYNGEPEVYAVYGYEAANVAMNALNQVCAKDRAKVLAAVTGTKDFSGILGTWSFDANGDTSLTDMSGAQVKGGKFEYVKPIK